MLKESLKYMLLSLLVAALMIAGAWYLLFGREMLDARRSAAQAGATPAPSIAAGAQDTPPAGETPPVSAASPTPAPSPSPSPDPDAALKAYIASMPMAQKLGQLVIFGFSGTESPGSAFLRVMEEYAVGNVMLYGANLVRGDDDGGFARAQTLLENARAGSTAALPPLVGVDEEGGTVRRFGWDTKLASARTLGERGSAQEAFEQYAMIARRLRENGVNFNVAPVLDVAESPMDTFLGSRMISADASVTAEIGAAIIGGTHDGGALAAAKHFPGHGGTREDSHETTPVVEKSIDELRAYDLIPFAAAVDAGVDVVLVAHILYPALDGTEIASMSQPVITGLLRETLGFTGVVMSDDFRMDGLTRQYEPGEAAVKFILAGGDLVLCGAQSERQRAIMEGLTRAAADGTLTEARIDESVLRILKAKQRVTEQLFLHVK